jgi:hypothetical protein
MRKYKVIKEFLKFNEGEVLAQENHDDKYYNADFHLWHERIHRMTIEANPDYFEEIKEPSKEWEIVAFKHKRRVDDIRTKWSDGTFTGGCGQNIFLEKSDEWAIYSVKRLSDGEVFSVGDEVEAREGEYCSFYNRYKIISMSVKGGMLAFEIINVEETSSTGSIWREIQNVQKIIPSNKQEPKEDVFVWTDKLVQELLSGYAPFADAAYSLPKHIENFKQSKNQLPMGERIGADVCGAQWVGNEAEKLVVSLTKAIHEDKFPLIKQAIEKILNP